jgi:antitoxin FitA
VKEPDEQHHHSQPRYLDPSIKERQRVRAAEHGHSMEAEARRILQTALSRAGRVPARNLYERIHARFAPLGGVDLELPPFRLMFAPDTTCCSPWRHASAQLPVRGTFA